MEPTDRQIFNRNKILAILLITLAAFAISGISMGVFFLRPVTRARQLVSRGAGLRVGSAGLQDIKGIAERFGVKPGPDCTAARCSLRVLIDNARLPGWWRGPETALAASFSIENGILVEEGFALWTVGLNTPYAEVREKAHWRELPEPVDVDKKWISDNPKWRVIVNLTPAAPPDLKRRYLSFNFWCLAKWHGCRNAQEMLPAVDWNK
jgi:hypothetical protein